MPQVLVPETRSAGNQAASRQIASRQRWEELWQKLGVVAPTGLYDEILNAWEGEDRAYHNADHLAACLEELDAYPEDIAEHDVLELAIWFHDVIYKARRQDNEEQSAELALNAVIDAGLDDSLGQRVAELILVTQHDGVPADETARILVDIDLSILGREPEVFEAYENAVRQEYSWAPSFLYRRGRRKVLRSFVERAAIYSTPFFRERYEARARENIAGSLARL